MATPSYAVLDPFYMSDSSSDADSDDSTLEPIDKQEIYGKTYLQISPCPLFLQELPLMFPRPYCSNIRSRTSFVA